MRRLRRGALAGAGLLLAAALLWVLLRPSGRSAISSATSSTARMIPAAERRALPRVSGEALDPPPARLEFGADGRPGFVDFWASWCTACREEASLLRALTRAYAGRIRFFGVDVNDTRGAARSFERRFGVNFPSIFDPHEGLASRAGVVGLPTAYLVDRRGRVAAVLIGRQRRRTLESLLARLAATAPARK